MGCLHHPSALPVRGQNIAMKVPTMIRATATTVGKHARALVIAGFGICASVGFLQGHSYGQGADKIDEALVETGLRVWQGRAGCFNCHGWAGNGEAEFNYPRGANLRASSLDAGPVAEIVKCGRPGTQMPYHDRAAYTDARCYGVTKNDLGDQTPPPGTSLQTPQIEAVAAYVVARIKGRGPITKTECADYFKDNPGIC